MPTLKFFNGRGYILRKREDPLWEANADGGSIHGYVAAYSRADAARVITEYLGRRPTEIETELREYWSPCWGDSMKGIAPERGIWVTIGYGKQKPIRLK